MRILLDSHVVLWWLTAHAALGPNAAAAIEAADDVVVSSVTPWELGIKRSLGKLDFPAGLVDELQASGIRLLSISARHAEAAPLLPAHHRDPFDRMLVAQAREESLALMTADRSIEPYDVPIIDARW